jgi:hypothetical protein
MTTEIDKIPRFKVSDFKEIFNAAKLIQRSAAMISQSDVDVLMLNYCTQSITLCGVRYNVAAQADANAHVYALTFTWYGNSARYSQSIQLAYANSNLNLDDVPQFVCPATNRVCRKLYIIDNALLSRYAFKHRYSYQSNSRSHRRMRTLLHKLTCSPYRKNGKPMYNGKITPYGRKIMQAYAVQLDPEAYAIAMADLDKSSARSASKLNCDDDFIFD